MMQRATSHVLIVDDREVSNLLTKFFRRRGYEVSTVANAEDALAFVRSELPDLVLLDVASPKIKGLAVLDQILKQTPGVAIITMAEEPNEEAARQSLRRGAVDFIPKPLDLRYLETAVLARLTITRV